MWVEANSGSGGGGTETETTLWENPSTSSTFSAQAVTLTADYTTFSKIAVYAYYQALYQAPLIRVAIFDTSYLTKGNSSALCVFGTIGSNNAYYRALKMGNSNTQLRIENAYKYGGGSTATTSYCIPTKITGIN